MPLAWPRFNTLLLVVFASAALLLSAIGLYGVMAASVRQRHGEIGVRLAIGATPADVRRLVLGEGLRLSLVGAVAGLALAFAATRVLRGLLFETEPLESPDPARRCRPAGRRGAGGVVPAGVAGHAGRPGRGAARRSEAARSRPCRGTG